MNNKFSIIIPYWPVKTSLKQNYFLSSGRVAVSLGYETTAYAYSTMNMGSLAIDGMTIIFYDSILNLLRLIPRKGIIHFQSANLRTIFTMFLFIARDRKQVKIWTPHTSFNVKKQPHNSAINIYRLFKPWFKYLKTIICISQYEYDVLRNMGYINIIWIPLVVEPVNRIIFTKPLILNKLQIVFIGGDRRIKNLTGVLKAILIIQKFHINVTLNIFGTITREYRQKHKHLLSKNIIFHGQVEPFSKSFIRILSKSHLYINNSWCEGTPLAAYESSIFGLGCCLSKLETLKSIFGTRAVYHNPGDAQKLAENILHYYYNPGILKADATFNINMIGKLTDENNINNKLVSLFKTL